MESQKLPIVRPDGTTTSYALKLIKYLGPDFDIHEMVETMMSDVAD